MIGARCHDRSPRGSSRGAGRCPGRGAQLRDGARRAAGLPRDRLPIRQGPRRGVLQAVPERHLEHPRGPVLEPHRADAAPAHERQSARPDPAADDGGPRQGRAAPEPRALRRGLRLGRVAGDAARAAPCRRGRPAARRGRPLRWRPELLDDRRVLQQGAGRADRHDRATRDARGVRGPAGQGEGGRPPAHHAVERRGQRWRPGLPAPEPHGLAGPDHADQRVDLPEGGRHDRHALEPRGRARTSSSGSRPATSPRT